MAHEKILEALGLGGIQILFLGHDRKGADMRAAKLRVVRVMMVVGTSPDAAGTQGPDSKKPHQKFREPGFWQDCVMLLIMINHEKPEA